MSKNKPKSDKNTKKRDAEAYFITKKVGKFEINH